MPRFCAALLLAGIAAAALRSRGSRQVATFVATLTPDELALLNRPCSRTLH